MCIDNPARPMSTAVCLSALVFLLGLTACASTSALRWGAAHDDVYRVVRAALAPEGYNCVPTPDLSVLDCRHSELVHLNIAYLQQSNFIEIWAAFDRKTDEGVKEIWRGDCEPLLPTVNAMNVGYVSKLSCTEDSFIISFYSWVPKSGLSVDDLQGISRLVGQMIGQTIVAAEMLRGDDDEDADGAPTEEEAGENPQ